MRDGLAAYAWIVRPMYGLPKLQPAFEDRVLIDELLTASNTQKFVV
jgi:hypothetical protein